MTKWSTLQQWWFTSLILKRLKCTVQAWFAMAGREITLTCLSWSKDNGPPFTRTTRLAQIESAQCGSHSFTSAVCFFGHHIPVREKRPSPNRKEKKSPRVGHPSHSFPHHKARFSFCNIPEMKLQLQKPWYHLPFGCSIFVELESRPIRPFSLSSASLGIVSKPFNWRRLILPVKIGTI